ncbi:DNA glycosylase AlkZ-like family protein [Pseudonocardia oroxyli]|uniref:Winged helix DNA-binding domain-containing protein n=1 Tax=Pseudonocardia oroxyli TaxID=366584 RepID=A0A1G7IR69_PSEOR|nr:crosslink repair DNA glycosylase YcaQ family protein [Pseudonocardia oroxyli]SDF15105.1 Winged helix DNA-binding domain-containing protein [Pseudonocardia oroxyli]
MRVTWRQVTRWRAVRRLLTAPETDPVAVSRRLCGLHAQIASSPAAIAGVRGASGVGEAVGDGRLVRTWAMRGTLHLMPADELGLWTAALADKESRRRFPPSFARAHGVDGETLHAITASIGRVLGTEPLTRAVLAERVIADLGRPELAEPLTSSWGSVFKPAAARGLLVSGPDGTFVSPGPLDRPDTDTANQEILLRFLRAHGPADADDVGRWWGERATPAKRRLRRAPVEPVDVEGWRAWVAAEDADELAATPSDGEHPGDGPFLLPAFDPWVIAPISHRRRAVPEVRATEVSRTAGWISPVLVLDGRVAGVWEPDGDTAVVRPFGPVPRSRVEALRAVRWG